MRLFVALLGLWLMSVAACVSGRESQNSLCARTSSLAEAASAIESYTLTFNSGFKDKYLDRLQMDTSFYFSSTIQFIYPFRAKILQDSHSIHTLRQSLSADERRCAFDKFEGRPVDDVLFILEKIFTPTELSTIRSRVRSKDWYWGIEFASNDGFGHQSAFYMSADTIVRTRGTIRAASGY